MPVAYTGKLGRSADMSQFLKIKNAALLQAFYSTSNPTNSPVLKTNYGGNYKRRGFQSGVVSTFLEKGIGSDFSSMFGTGAPVTPPAPPPVLNGDLLDLNPPVGSPVGPRVDGGTPTSTNTYAADGKTPTSAGIAYHIDGNTSAITYT